MRNTRARHRLLAAVKITFWTLMAAFLLVLGLGICVVRVLKPEILTPLLTRYANQALDADVRIGRVDLKFRGSYPFVDIDIDTVVITSRQIKELAPDTRAAYPAWADTLLALDRLHGGFNIPRALSGDFEISDVEILRPQLNICEGREAVNYAIFRSSDDDDEDDDNSQESIDIPDIRLSRFRFVDPKPVRYADLVNDVRIDAFFSAFDISNAGDGHDGRNRYDVRFSTNVEYPVLERLGLGATLPVSLEGSIEWSNRKSSVLLVSDLRFAVGRLSGSVDSELDFTDRFTLNSLDFTLDPISVSWAMGLIPDSTAVRLSIPRDIRTDADLGLRLTVERPYTIERDILPHATLHLSLPDCSVSWRQYNIDRLAMDADIHFRGLNVNNATLQVNDLRLQGDPGYLRLSGTLSRPLTTPVFDGVVDSRLDLTRLPAPLLDALPAAVSGQLTAQARVKADATMLNTSRYPLIRADGRVTVDDFTWLADDTLKMYHIHHMDVELGTDGDSVLSAAVSIDRAEMLASDIAFRYRDIDLAVAPCVREGRDGRVPLRGHLHAGDFSMATLTSGGGMSVRGLDGTIDMPLPTAAESPLFLLDMSAPSLSAGGRENRLILDVCRLQASAGRLRPEPPTPERYLKKKVIKSADSLHRVKPSIPLDSVYTLALAIHNINHPPGHHRIHPATDARGDEYIDWGATRVAYDLLCDWAVDGTLTASGGRYSAPGLTQDNSIRDFNIRFNTDSVVLTGIAARVGRSDFLISGCISDIGRSITATDGRLPLKIHFGVRSDTIDIDQIGEALLGDAGNGYNDTDNDTAGKDASPRTPLLIPGNITAELDLRASRVIYSGLVMRDFSGTALMYGGALNLHRFQARSDIGSVMLSALYSAPSAHDINAGVGLQVKDFNIADFLQLVPAVDSVMPMLRHLGGVVSADIAATTDISPDMDFVVPSMRVAMTLQGDSLRVRDPETYRDITRWLLLRPSQGDVIPHATAQLTLQNGHLDLYPFIFDFNRYRLGVQGTYDLDSAYNYQVAVLHSPIPFRFGINISGTPGHCKVRFGGPGMSEHAVVSQHNIAADRRINLVSQLEEVFNRGERNARLSPLPPGHGAPAPQLPAAPPQIQGLDAVRSIITNIDTDR